MKRLVLDTNVVAALLWGGKPRIFFEAAAERRIALFTSAPLLDEPRSLLYDGFRYRTGEEGAGMTSLGAYGPVVIGGLIVGVVGLILSEIDRRKRQSHK